MPSKVTATLLPERCEPIRVASDPATSGADRGGQRDSRREGLGVGRDRDGGLVGAGWRIEGQPAATALVDRGDTPPHDASTGVVYAEAARSTGHGAAGLA